MFTPDDEMRFIILPQVSPFCGPLFFYSRPPSSAAGKVTASGSFGLVDTGAKKLLVTCHHVWAAFQEEQAKDPSLTIFLGLGLTRAMALGTPPIDQDKELDLATFDMESLLPACNRRKFYRVNSLSSNRLKKGDLLFFLGYPGCLRSVSEEIEHFNGAAYPVIMTGVDGPRFYADISDGTVTRVGKSGISVRDYRHPGISGSPCFEVRPERPAKLVGFVTSVWRDLLWFTSVDSVNTDGTIKRTAYPPSCGFVL